MKQKNNQTHNEIRLWVRSIIAVFLLAGALFSVVYFTAMIWASRKYEYCQCVVSDLDGRFFSVKLKGGDEM